MRNHQAVAVTLATVLGVAVLGVTPAKAQWRPTTNTPNQNQNQNPDPQRDAGQNQDSRRNTGGARISVADGEVEVQRESGDRIQGRSGMPMMSQDAISTGRSSRAEVQLGPGNLVRLNEETRLRVVDVGNRYYRIEVLSGTVNVSQLRGGEADVDVMAPNTTVRPLKRGVYRITVREGIQTDLTVRKGEAEIVSSRGGEKVKSGNRASVRGDRQSAELRVNDAEPKDAFDRWNERRDDVLEPNYGGGGLLYAGGFGPGFYDPFWGPGLGLGFGGFGPYGGFGYGGFGGLGYRGIGFGPTVVIGRGGWRGGGFGGRGRR